MPPEFKLFIPTAPATRGITSGAAGGAKPSLRGKEAVLEAKAPSTQSAIDELREVGEDEIVEESSAVRDGSILEVREPACELDDIDQRTDVNDDGLVDEKLYAASLQ